MRTFISWFFYILGVIFFILILIGGYLYVADPLGLRSFAPLVTGGVTQKAGSVSESTKTPESPAPTTDAHPYLSEKQEAVLETVGINPAALPTSVTPTQQTCLIQAVGEARANEIKNGALPTPMEILKAKSCL